MNQFKSQSGILTGVEHEQGGLGRGMNPVIVNKLGDGGPIVPVVLSLVDEEPKELFNLLVDMFGLAIWLQVVCHRGCDFDSEDLAEAMHEVQHELGALIANYLLGKAVQFPDIVLK